MHFLQRIYHLAILDRDQVSINKLNSNRDKVKTILFQYLHHSHRAVNIWLKQLTMQQHVVAMLVSDQALNQTECVTVQKTWHSHLDSTIYYRLYLFTKIITVINLNILKQINTI